MSDSKPYKFSDFLHRSKLPININNAEKYTRVTIKIKHNGVSCRDVQIGSKIGTKKQFILKKGQFVLSKIDARYGAFGIAPQEVDGAIITGNFWAYDVDDKLISIEWLNHFTSSSSFYDICERASSGITHRKYLNERTFLSTEIYLPNINNQKMILQEIAKKENYAKNVKFTISHQKNLLKKLRQQILQDAIEGKLTADWRVQHPDVEPASKLLERIATEKVELIKAKKIKPQKPLPQISDTEKPFELPEGWEWCRIQNVTQLITSGSRDWAKYYSKSGAIFLTMSNLTKGDYKLRMNSIRYVTPPKNKEGSRTKLEEGDLLVSITGDVGNLGVIPKNFGEAYINQHTCLLRFMPECQNKYFLDFMRTPWAKSQFDAPQRGIKNSFRLGDVGEMSLPLPPLPEQKAIIAKVEKLLAMCDELEIQINANETHAEQLMQAVLKEAFTRTNE